MAEMAETNNPLDSEGLTEGQGRDILLRLRDEGFEADDQKLAVALGRPVEEVQAWTSGGAPVDDDLIMKARGIAQERGINLE
ncbi:MAG: hypothetical protein LC785_11505 [Acidobacteria bacterium]|nr:hypothetical protein [Acidobacteriota bacterium]MCA1642551.1 hypothetical protein [Acidobacteriota bacterium]